MSLTLQTVTGNALLPFIDDIARLRIEVFRDFPYLYDGDMDYERRYLQTYEHSEQAAVVIAKDGTNVVGASTCLPMQSEEPAFQAPLATLNLAPEHVLYLAESVLHQDYRGRGVGVQFFQAREHHAKSQNGISHCCFCAVERPQDHPLRPNNYTPLHAFWRKRGYQPTDAYARYSWLDTDQSQPTEKRLRFWTKTL